MAVTNADLQRLWEDAWDAAPEAVNTFRGQLRAFEAEVGRLISKGSLSSVAKNSASQSYAGFSPGSLTQADLARAWRELINLFDRLLPDFLTDELIYAEGIAYLANAPTECATDFSEARR